MRSLPVELLITVADFVPCLGPLRSTCRRWADLLRGWEGVLTGTGPSRVDWSAVRRLTVDMDRPLPIGAAPVLLHRLTARVRLPQLDAHLTALSTMMSQTARAGGRTSLAVACAPGYAAAIGPAVHHILSSGIPLTVSVRWGPATTVTVIGTDLSLCIGTLGSDPAGPTARSTVDALLALGAATVVRLDVDTAWFRTEVDDPWMAEIGRLGAGLRALRTIRVALSGPCDGIEAMGRAPALRSLHLKLCDGFCPPATAAALVAAGAEAALRTLRLDVTDGYYYAFGPDAPAQYAAALRSALTAGAGGELEDLDLRMPGEWIALLSIVTVPRVAWRRLRVRMGAAPASGYDFLSSDGEEDAEDVTPETIDTAACLAAMGRIPTLRALDWACPNNQIIAAAGAAAIGDLLRHPSLLTLTLRMGGAFLGADAADALAPCVDPAKPTRLRVLRLDLHNNLLNDAAVRSAAAAVRRLSLLEDVQLSFDDNPDIRSTDAPNAFADAFAHSGRIRRLALSFRNTGVRWADGWGPLRRGVCRAVGVELTVAFTVVQCPWEHPASPSMQRRLVAQDRFLTEFACEAPHPHRLRIAFDLHDPSDSSGSPRRIVAAASP